MAKNNHIKIMISTLIVLIVSILSLIIMFNTMENIMYGNYMIKCSNGTIEEFNYSDILVCNQPNPLHIPQEIKYNVT